MKSPALKILSILECSALIVPSAFAAVGGMPIEGAPSSNDASADDIKKPLDAIRSAASRKGVSTVDSKTNSLIVTDTQEGLKEVEDLIPVLDRKPSQVDIETKIVEVSLDNSVQTGISWNY